MTQHGEFLTTSTGTRLRDTDHSLKAGIDGDADLAVSVGLTDSLPGVHFGAADTVVEGLLGSMRRHRAWERFATSPTDKETR